MSINATLIGQMITFALLVWFTMKYVWPPIMQALEERKKKISEASDIVGRAQKRAGDVVEESKQNARQEGERIVLAARAEIDREVQKAKEGLRQQVAELAMRAAEQILRQEVDRTRHQAIIDNLDKALSEK